MRKDIPWRLWVIQLAIVAAPIAYGTVHAIPVAIFEIVGFALFTWWALEQYHQHQNLAHFKDPLLLLGLGGIALGLIQLVPLPFSWVAVLSPGTADLVRTPAGIPGMETPTYHSLAVVPLDTEKGLAWLAAMIAWYAVIQHEIQDRRGARRIVRTIAYTGLGLALLGLAQGLTKANAIFWIGLERDAFYATFVNPNNAAGMLTLATAACLAMAFTLHREKRVLWYLGALLTAVSTVFSLSRGGMGVLAFCLLFTTWFAAAGSFEGRSGVWNKLGPLFLIAGVFGFVMWIGSTEVVGELESVQHDHGLNGRTEIWNTALTRMWPRFPLFGTGYGNFDDLFAVYSTTTSKVDVTAAENEYLQVLFEGGLVGFGLLCTALGIILKRAVWGMRNIRRAGMTVPLTAGLGAILLHMLIDFPMHLGGPALWVLTFIALVSRRPQEMVKRRHTGGERILPSGAEPDSV
jgi:O-antigen ligase